MNIDLEAICLAVLEQGKNKGERCWRPAVKDGYCGKHKTQAILIKGKESGKKKCKRFRCTTMIDQESNHLYCTLCESKKKEEREGIKQCIASIQQGAKKGSPCDKAASHEEYCRKHYEYNRRLQEAASKNIRICDDGKRACKQPTKDGKLRCEDCLAKDRESNKVSYSVLQMDFTKCLGCGITLDQPLKGKRGKDVQQCESCYNKQRKIEDVRERESRDFNAERKKNVERHMNEYISSSYKRGKPFELSQEQFEKLVTSPCCYCGFHSESVIGIDRIDSEKGYIEPNTVPCCADCNQIKGTRTPFELKEHITKMYFHMMKDTSAIDKHKNNDITQNKSWLRPSQILSKINNKQLDEYIQWCKEDARSPAYIAKLEDLRSKTMNYSDTLAYIKNALRTESNKQKKTSTNIRQRIDREELFGFLELNAPSKFIEHYEAAHGSTEGLLQNISNLQRQWKDLSKENKYKALTKTLIRLQNTRNRS